MKHFAFLTIMALLSFKLNAFDVSYPLRPETFSSSMDSPDAKDLEVFIKKAREENFRSYEGRYRLEREKRLTEVAPCSHCPKFLSLTGEINKVVAKMAADPNLSTDEVPLKLNKLKFLYYTQKIRAEDGGVECQRFMDYTPDLKPTKWDGQFQLMAEDALRFSAVTDIQYIDPKTEESVYYYRGEGDDKNIVVQAILTKEGGRFRYYRYYPTKEEDNPYNLPDLDLRSVAQTDEIPAVPDPVETLTNEEKTSFFPKLGNYALTFKAKVEKRNKYIPKNVHFVEASADQDLLGDFKVKASTDFSLKGNEAKLALKNGEDDLMVVELKTKMNGKTEHKVVVPFSVRVNEDLPTLKGKAEINNGGEVLNLSLTDKGIDLMRSEFRRNGSTGATSYVLSRDIVSTKNEVLTMQYGSDEDQNKFIGLRHAKAIKDHLTLAMDVRVNEDKKVTLVYQANVRW
jgi:hypothetical protein